MDVAGGRVALLSMVDPVMHTVSEVRGGSAHRERAQVQVISGLGQSMEQLQLKHDVAKSKVQMLSAVWTMSRIGHGLVDPI